MGGQCTLCFPLLLAATEPKYWEEQNSPLHSSAPARSAGLVPGMWGRDRNPLIPRDLRLSPALWDNPLAASSSSPKEWGQVEQGRLWAWSLLSSGCCWPSAMRFSWAAIRGGTGWTSLHFPFSFFWHCCAKFELCPLWMKPLLKKSLLCFCFFLFLFCF